jgi:hypothetical protein
VASGFKGGVLLSQSYFSLRDTVQILMGGRAKESRSNVKFQEKSKNLLDKARELEFPPEPISHSNHRGAAAPCQAHLYISTKMSARLPSEYLSAAATTGVEYSGFSPTPPIKSSQIWGDMVYKIGPSNEDTPP